MTQRIDIEVLAAIRKGVGNRRARDIVAAINPKTKHVPFRRGGIYREVDKALARLKRVGLIEHRKGPAPDGGWHEVKKRAARKTA